MAKPIVFKLSGVEHRLHELPEGKTYIKPFVNVRNSESMAGGLNFLNKVSVPWSLTCDEMIYCHQGTFRLVCDGQSRGLDFEDIWSTTERGTA